MDPGHYPVSRKGAGQSWQHGHRPEAASPARAQQQYPGELVIPPLMPATPHNRSKAATQAAPGRAPGSHDAHSAAGSLYPRLPQYPPQSAPTSHDQHSGGAFSPHRQPQQSHAAIHAHGGLAASLPSGGATGARQPRRSDMLSDSFWEFSDLPGDGALLDAIGRAKGLTPSLFGQEVAARRAQGSPGQLNLSSMNAPMSYGGGAFGSNTQPSWDGAAAFASPLPLLAADSPTMALAPQPRVRACDCNIADAPRLAQLHVPPQPCQHIDRRHHVTVSVVAACQTRFGTESV